MAHSLTGKRAGGRLATPKGAPVPRMSYAQSAPRTAGGAGAAVAGGTNMSTSFASTSFSGSGSAQQVLDDTPRHRLELAGHLPIAAKEILFNLGDSSHCSVRMDAAANAAWMVLSSGAEESVRASGAAIDVPQVLVWPLTAGKGRSGKSHEQCRRLPLQDGGRLLGARCVAMTPGTSPVAANGALLAYAGGRVVYWPSIENDAALVLDLDLGEEADHVLELIEAEPACHILATKAGRLFAINLTNESTGAPALTFRRLQRVQTDGSLFGLGLRMTSLFGFGGGAAAERTSPIVAISAAPDTSEDSRVLLELTERSLALWTLSSRNPHCLFREIDLLNEEGRPLGDLEATIEGTFPDHSFRQAVLLDVFAATAMRAQVLVALLPAEEGGATIFLLGDVCFEAASTTSDWSVVPFRPVFHSDSVDELLDVRLAVPADSGAAYIVNTRGAIVVPTKVGGDDREPNILSFADVSGSASPLIGQGVSGDDMFIITAQHGGVLVRVVQKDIERATRSTFEVEEMQAALSVGDRPASQEQMDWLAASFDKFCQDDRDGAAKFVDRAFGNLGDGFGAAVRKFSLEVLDAIPPWDPRWAEEEGRRTKDSSETTSLIIIRQLEDKQAKHLLLISFLLELTIPATEAQLWDMLGGHLAGSDFVSTRELLCEDGEKVAACIVLRSLHSRRENTALLDGAIVRALERRQAASHDQLRADSDLGPHDRFYKDVSQIGDLFPCLLAEEEAQLQALLGPSQLAARVRIVQATNNIINAVLREAATYRQRQSALYRPQLGKDGKPLFQANVPWTANAEIQKALQKQAQTTIDRAIADASDRDRQNLYHQLYTLSDFLLEARTLAAGEAAAAAAASDAQSEGAQQLAAERTDIIGPFAQDPTQIEHAYRLAEKYRDFQTLVALCEQQGDRARLDRYTKQFGESFQNFVFKWYLEKGNRRALLDQPSQRSAALSQFLKPHDHLRWLHDIHTQDFGSAHRALSTLAAHENQHFLRQKTLWSLSKLCHLADDGPADEDTLSGINDKLSLLQYQEHVPTPILERVCAKEGVELEKMRPLTCEELINLFTDVKNGAPAAAEADEVGAETYFVFALEILYLYLIENVSDEEVQTWRQMILTGAVLKDAAVWRDLRGDEPLDELRETTFFRTLAVALGRGMQSELVPTKAQVGELLEGSFRRQLQPLLDANKQLAHHLRLACELAAEASQ